MNHPSLTIVKTESSTGSWQDAQDQALWAPAAKALGISYRRATSKSWMDARDQVEAGAVEWDIIQIALAEVPQARAANALERLDADVIDKADFVPGSCTDHFVANSLYSTVIAWNTARYENRGPSSKADFWDVKRFPGKRALWNEPVGMIEAAAMAAGASRHNVYGFLSDASGREAAMAKLTDIAPHVTTWWESGDEASQLIDRGDVDLILTWSGRVQNAIDQGACFAYTFNDGQLGTDGYAVVKDAPNRELAMRFLKEISKPEYQKALAGIFPTAPVNMKAFEIANYAAEKMATMASAPSNVAVQYAADPEFWTQHGRWVYDAYEQVRRPR